MADIKLTTDDWVSVSTLSGIAAGTQLKLQNKGILYLLVQESATKPDITNFDGEIITTLEKAEASKIILEGGLEVWARIRTVKGGEIYMHVQSLEV